jgi:HK97 family phage portal protein
MRLLDRIAFDMGSAFMRAAGVSRPDWPAWLIGLEQFILSDENLKSMQAYASVPDVYFCTSLLQDFIAALPLDFYEGRGDTRVKLDPDEPGTPGFLWKAANKRQTGYDLTHDLIGHFLLGGNLYLMMEFDNPSNAPTIVSALWNLPSQNMTPVLAAGREVAHYTFMQDGMRPLAIPPEQVVHACDFNPEDVGYGLSRVEVLRLVWQRQRNMDRFEHEFYKRGGTAAGLYTTDATLLPPQHRQLRDDLNQRVEGPQNFGRALLLPKGVKFERAGMTHAEMQFIETGNVTLATLLRAFKIPPILAGVKSSGLGSSDKGGQNDMLLFIEHGVRPITRRLTAKFNEVLLRPPLWHGRVLSCEFDYSRVLAMQDVFLAQAQAYQAATGNAVMTVNEARERLGLAPSDEEQADTLFQKVPEPTLPPAIASKDSNKKPTGTEEGKPTIAAEASPSGTLVRDLMRARSAVKQERHIERTRRMTVRRFRNQQQRIVDVLMDSQRELTSELVPFTYTGSDGAAFILDASHGATEQRAINLDILLMQLDDEHDRELVRRLIESIVKQTGNATMSELGVEVSFSLLTNSAQQFIKEQTLSFITHVDDTTRRMLREALAEGIGNGETPMELVKRTAKVFDFRRANAQTIAITESGTAYNAAQLEASRQARDQTGLHIIKEWLTAEDENVRGTPGGRKAVENAEFSHFTADGQRAELDEFFYVGSPMKDRAERGPMPGDEPCLMPGDPSLSAGNRINCRCVARYLALDDAPTGEQESMDIEEMLRR